jgi:hypothetical protein
MKNDIRYKTMENETWKPAKAGIGILFIIRVSHDILLTREVNCQ